MILHIRVKTPGFVTLLEPRDFINLDFEYRYVSISKEFDRKTLYTNDFFICFFCLAKEGFWLWKVFFSKYSQPLLHRYVMLPMLSNILPVDHSHKNTSVYMVG